MTRELVSILEGNPEAMKLILKGMEDKFLKRLYKASKQLSDLCWQEIQRRKRHPTDTTTLDDVDVIKAGGTQAEIQRRRGDK